MEIIEPSVEILTPINGLEALKMIELAGRTCYLSEDKITDDSCVRFVKMLIERKHEAMLEHFNITVKIVTNRGCCYDRNTMVLTNHGWKYFKNINDLDLFYTLDKNNNLVLLDKLNYIDVHFKGDLYRFHTTQVDLCVTPNHNMLVKDYNTRKQEWKIVKAKDLKNKRYSFLKGGINYTGNKMEDVLIPALSVKHSTWTRTYEERIFNAENFFKLMGFIITDGSIGRKRISITQIKSGGRKYIKSVLDSLKIKYIETEKEFRINDRQLATWFTDQFIQGEDRRKTYYLSLPKWILNSSKANLNSLLEGIIAGDGSKHTRGTGWQIYTVSKAFALDLTELALKVGYSANIYEHEPRKNDRKIQERVKSYVVSIVTTKETLYNKKESTFERIPYDDRVYCVELPRFHKLYVMRNGKPTWCGNSHELVRHRLASFAQTSTRYVSYNKKPMQFIRPCFWSDGYANIDNAKKIDTWLNALKITETSYNELLAMGAKPEEAREVLPNSLATSIIVTANLREWRHIFNLRTSKFAHPEIRKVMNMLLNQLKNKLPVIFDDIDV